MAQNGAHFFDVDAMPADIADPNALFQIGLRYAAGQGVPQDYVTAHRYLNLAAMGGSRPARDLRAEIAQDMTPGQISQAQRLARESIKVN